MVLRGVAAFFTHGVFELAEPHAIGVGEIVVRLGVECFAFLKRLPQPSVTHNHGVDHAKFVKRKLVLPQNAHFLGPGDGTFGGLEFPG